MSWKIFSKNGAVERCEIRALTYTGTFMGERCITFTLSSPYPIPFEIGDFLTYRGERFELNYLPSKEKVATSGSYGEAFKYADVKMNSVGDELARCNFLDYVKSDNQIHYSGLSKFSFYASSVGALAERIGVNLDRIYTSPNNWTIDVNPALSDVEMSIDVSNINCNEALALINEKWDLYFTITGRTIKIGYELEMLPAEFTYKDKGLYSIKQDTKQDVQLITRLRAFGSTKNMPYRYYNGKGNVPDSMYCPNLMLPGFITSGGDMYIDSPNIAMYGIREATVYFDGTGDNEEIYPTITNMTADRLASIGTIVSIPPEDNGRLDEIIDAADLPTDNGILPAPDSGDKYTRKEFHIVLKDIGFDLNDYLSTQATATIVMNSGMCISREFEIVECVKNTSYLGYTRYVLTCLQYVDTDLNIAFPNNAYTLNVSDKFVLVNISMPEVYIKAAEQRLLEAATEYLSKQDKPHFTFDPKIWRGYFPSRQAVADSLIEGKLMPVRDTDLEIDDAVPIQVLTIKEGEDLLPFYEVTLSEDLVVSRLQKIQNDIKNVEKNVINGIGEVQKITKRQFRDAIELSNALIEAFKDEFEPGITPTFVHTMQLLVGSDRLQYRFVDNKINPVEVDHAFDFDAETKEFSTGAGIIQHMTLGIDTLTPTHDAIEYTFWDVSSYTWIVPDMDAYWLYIRCSQIDSSATFLLSKDVIEIDDEVDYYHFICGYLNSEYEGKRSFVTMYGFTEVLPGQIRANKIATSDGLQYWDMLSKMFKIGDTNSYVSWNVDKPNQLVIKGTLVQSQGGDTYPIGVFRGEYNSLYTYYKGDEVTYMGSTYHYTSDTPSSAVPTNTLYWMVVAAKGEDGSAPDWKTFAYIKSPTKPVKPTDTISIPVGWKDYPDSDAVGGDEWWMIVAVVHWDGSDWLAGSYVNDVFTPGLWSEPIQVTGEQGTDGQFIDFKFAATVNMNQPVWNGTLEAMLNPTGWYDQPPSLPSDGAIWMIQAWKQAGGTQLITTWSAPVRISGEKGLPGAAGSHTSFVFYASDINPGTPVSMMDPPPGWFDAPVDGGVSVSYDSAWSLWSGTGLYQSPAIGMGGFTKSRMTFTTTSPNEKVVVYLHVEGEYGLDYALVGLLDNAGLTISTNYTDRITGYNSAFITVNVPVAGSHFIDVGFGKGGSQGGGYAQYKALSSTWWMSKATITGLTPGLWSAPVQVTGEDGVSGLDGKFWDYRYRAWTPTSLMPEPLAPTGLDPTSQGWVNQPPSVPSGGGLWMSYCEKNADQTSILWGWSAPVRISGEKGQDGTDGSDGDYYEYRYAISGSPSSPPSLINNVSAPAGWSVTMPTSITVGWYLWMTVAKKTSSGALASGWTWGVPVRTMGVDGVDGSPGAPGAPGTPGAPGSSPVLNYRGVYSPTAQYYGNEKRLEAVQYNGTYYVSRIDAYKNINPSNPDVTFSNVLPTNTAYWNTFGAQFDSVATGLLLAQIAYIENLVVGRLSTGTSTSIPRLLASGTEIAMYPNEASESNPNAALIRIGAEVCSDYGSGSAIPGAIIQTDAYGTGALYLRRSEITPNGIYSNGAHLTFLDSTLGVPNFASIVGRITGEIMGSAVSGYSSALVGINQATFYGNIGNKSFGAWINRLYVNGINMLCKRLYDTYYAADGGNVSYEYANTYDPTVDDVVMSCHNTAQITIRLPWPQIQGSVYYIRKNSTGNVYLDASSMGNGRLLLEPGGNTTWRINITNQGEFATVIWDGLYWLYSSTTQ